MLFCWFSESAVLPHPHAIYYSQYHTAGAGLERYIACIVQLALLQATADPSSHFITAVLDSLTH